MTISALVVTLDPLAQEQAYQALSIDPRLTLGGSIGGRLPLVAETDTPRDGVELVEELLLVPGVLHVDVVSVDFTEERA
jgi:hypothetical protein